MPYAELAKPEFAHRVFAPFYDIQGFARYRAAVFNPRRKAGVSWFVPNAQAGVPCQLANLFFGECGIEQRSHDPMRTCGFLSRTKIALVVKIDPVSDRVKTTLCAQPFHQRK